MGTASKHFDIEQSIITDTREQKPLWRFYWAKLEVGDYTTPKLKDRFHVERKSPGDLYGTLLKGHNRFRREILRAQESGTKLVIVIECTAKKFYAKDWPGGRYCRFSSISLERCINTMSIKYDLEFIWCRSRSDARKVILERFKKEEQKWKKTS